jgi:hypothetical protein
MRVAQIGSSHLANQPISNLRITITKETSVRKKESEVTRPLSSWDSRKMPHDMDSSSTRDAVKNCLMVSSFTTASSQRSIGTST